MSPHTSSSFSAIAPAIGYYYQALYALIVLLDGDDDLIVSVETSDDVVASSKNAYSLHQLKYSGKKENKISIKSDGLWSTIRIWSKHLRNNKTDIFSFHFVTTADLGSDNQLEPLTSTGSDRTSLIAALESEANRVIAARKKCTSGKIPYAKRHKGCEEYLSLSPKERKHLIDNIELCPKSFTPSNIEHQVESRLTLVPPIKRNMIAKRIIEWWDTQVFKSLTKERSVTLSKLELQTKQFSLIQDISDGVLIDDFSSKYPADILAESSEMMVKQIELVHGTKTEISRAARDKWRAWNQRSRWIDDDISIAKELTEYDSVLIEEWDDRHSNIMETSVGITEKIKDGHNLLKWTYEDAPTSVQPIRHTWESPFLVRGIYQILSDELKVGWHPDYKEMIKNNKK